MKGSFLKIVFTVLALVVCSALEELLPHPGSVGFPLLLGFSLFASERWTVFAMVFVAIAAGGCEDSLSGLPYLSSMMYFLLCGAAMRWSRAPVTSAVAAYPFYQLWQALWGTCGLAVILPRFIWAIPVGAVTVLCLRKAFARLSDKAGIE